MKKPVIKFIRNILRTFNTGEGSVEVSLVTDMRTGESGIVVKTTEKTRLKTSSLNAIDKIFEDNSDIDVIRHKIENLKVEENLKKMQL